MRRNRMLMYLCCSLLLLLLSPAHGGPADPRPVGGVITPAHFRFKEIVPVSDQDASGWKAACVIARMNVVETKQSWECVFEVGVPQINKYGRVTDTAAAIAASVAANAAARVALGVPPPHISAVQCKTFRELTETLLKAPVSGARVSELSTLKRAECSTF